MALTPDQIKTAWKIRSAGQSWNFIGKALGVSGTVVRRALYPEYYGHKKYAKLAPGFNKVLKQQTKVPESVLEQREAMYRLKMSDALTIGQTLLGDPLPGQSALDKKRLGNVS